MAAEPRADRELKARHRAMWASGDYPRLTRDVISDLGPTLVTASGITAGQRVLDVGAGSGNAAIPAAELGASVVASDLTPELLDAGRVAAAARGVELEWIEADAEALPFDDDEFDVVLSCIGAMFAPDHQAVADELVRVCRPGGTIGMLNWRPGGTVEAFFGVFAPYNPPPPPGARSPLAWGTEEHLRELFGARVESLRLERDALVIDHFAKPDDLPAYFKRNFGPAIAAYANVADAPERTAGLDLDFLTYAERWNRGAPDGAVRYEYEYLLAVGQKAFPTAHRM